MITIIAATTDAAKVLVKNSRGTNGRLNDASYPSLWACGLGAGEKITLQIPNTLNPDVANDTHWVDMYDEGFVVELSSTYNIRSIFAVTVFRLVKPSTTAAVPVLGTGWTIKV